MQISGYEEIPELLKSDFNEYRGIFSSDMPEILIYGKFRHFAWM